MDYEEAFTQYFYRFLLKVEDPPSVWRALFGKLTDFGSKPISVRVKIQPSEVGYVTTLGRIDMIFIFFVLPACPPLLSLRRGGRGRKHKNPMPPERGK